MTPTKDQIGVARRLVGHRTDAEILERMEKLKKIQKGAGWPMYESLKLILAERETARK